MAEELTRPGRFYCYQCKTEITPRYPDCICPQCESGFIEELPEERSCDHDSASTSSTSDQGRSAFELFSGYGPFTLGILGETFDLQTPLPTEDNPETENRRDRDTASRLRCNVRHPWSRRVFRRQGTQQEGEPTIEGIIQQLINGIIAPTTTSNNETETWTLLHSAPLDYVWGANGLDAIIAQLMNQYENTGPPPADREQIKRLPTISITEEHVDAGLECPVCKEDYGIEETVRQLPCHHLFHNDCIVPWLEQHDTCPVCRKSLTGQNTATDNPVLSGNTCSPSSSTSPPSPPPEPPSNEDAAGNT